MEWELEFSRVEREYWKKNQYIPSPLSLSIFILIFYVLCSYYIFPFVALKLLWQIRNLEFSFHDSIQQPDKWWVWTKLYNSSKLFVLVFVKMPLMQAKHVSPHSLNAKALRICYRIPSRVPFLGSSSLHYTIHLTFIIFGEQNF